MMTFGPAQNDERWRPWIEEQSKNINQRSDEIIINRLKGTMNMQSTNIKPPDNNLQEYQIVRDAVQEATGQLTIEVEKLLCEKLGRQWTPSGMSISTLVEDLSRYPQSPPDDWMEGLKTALLKEHERSFRQRDAYIKTGRSTAAHGGSHDTCFEHIIREHWKKLNEK